jgi:GDP-D-mannose 3',5'-epimerase
MYVDGCEEGLGRLMASEYRKPLSLGTDRLISIDGLVDLVCDIAGKKLAKNHDVNKPQGARGRNGENGRLRDLPRWEPSISLEEGLAITCVWIESELTKAGRIPKQVAAHV